MSNNSNLIKIAFMLFLVLFLANITYSQNETKKIIHPLMGALTLSAEAGATFTYTDYTNTKNGFIWRGSAEYYLPTFTNHLVAIKIFGGTGNLQGDDERVNLPDFKTDIGFFGSGITYGYRIGEKIFPTIFAGLSYLSFDPKDVNGNPLPNNAAELYSKNDINLNAEIGLKYLITNELTFNLNFGTTFNFNDWLDDLETGDRKDIFYTFMAGLTLNLIPRKDSDNDGVEDSEDLCPDTPDGIEVDVLGCPIDEDRDGVADYNDKCPNTPARVRVDAKGCPLDSDRDGVSDYLDRCPNTPPGVKINRFGCPLDSDGDRVPDYWDKCPKTPRGIRVDSLGCPVDLDKDRVPDYLDKCPNTPHGILVDNTGCPLDSDRDGVADYLDKCPNTPLGIQVTIDGCSDEFQEYIFYASTTFKTGEAFLSPGAYVELDKVIARIKLHPNSEWRIEGHTDNHGEPEFNKVLSYQRAQAVFNYFISKGLNKNTFEVVGLGEDFPIADNSTAEGRVQNRRVVLIRVE
ncbi:MAG: OmpA family protein [Ignavibacteriaceae bacterium]|nr:OmpA family protein [Ignavibacteriaceae bacterium]